VANPIPYLGEALSLISAVGWAFAVILFKKSGETVHPIALNLGKNCIGAFCFGVMICFSGFSNRAPDLFCSHLADCLGNDVFILLILSGVLGIGIADSLFFACLNLLGAGLSSIVDCLYAPFVILFAYIFLGESLTILQMAGVLLIAAAILFTTQIRNSEKIETKRLMMGIALGFLAMATMALGIIIMKPILALVPLSQVIFIRLIGGIAFISVSVLFYKNRRSILFSYFDKSRLKYTLSSSFLGGFLVLFMWMGGFKYTNASISSALNQMSTIFVFVFAAIFLKEAISREKLISFVLAITGAFLVTVG
jgi:drug/metabolite transporter (DMT)-like permease